MKLRDKYFDRIYSKLSRNKVKALLAKDTEPFINNEVIVSTEKYSKRLHVVLGEPEEINIIDFEQRVDEHNITLDAKSKIWPGAGYFSLYPVVSVKEMKMTKDNKAMRYAYSDEERYLFEHHTEEATSDADNDSVTCEMLVSCYEELLDNDYWLPPSISKSVFNHISAHAKYFLRSATASSELQFYMDSINASDFDADPNLERVMVYDERIFKVGTWNGKPYTKADVLEMVVNYEEFSSWFIPPLKDGHDNIKERKDGKEAGLGLLRDPRVVEDWLVGDLDFSAKDHDTYIKTKKLTGKSIEVFNSIKKDGIEYKNVIKAVALLGISTPAVDDLGPIESYFSKSSDSYTVRPEVDIVVFDTEKGIGVDFPTMMSKDEREEMAIAKETETKKDAVSTEKVEELQSQLAEVLKNQLDAKSLADEATAKLVKELEDSKAANVEAARKLTLANDNMKKLQEEFKSDRANFEKREDESFVEGLVKGKNITPALVDNTKAMFTALRSADGVASFAMGDKEASDVTAIDLFKELMGSVKMWDDVEASKNANKLDSAGVENTKDQAEELVEANDGNKYPATNLDIAEMATEIVTEFATAGKTISYAKAQVEAETRINAKK